jgi:CAI-1 autoinducer synthase
MTTASTDVASPLYPAWLIDHVQPQCDFIAGLRPFPFDQPPDIRGYLSLHQNDYLRLSNRPEVIHQRAQANGALRIESFSSSVFGGASAEHDQFVALLKRSLRAGDVVLTTAGWTANVGLLEAIARPEMPVYLDAEAHASIDDGIRLAHAAHVFVRHNDPDHLDKRIGVFGPGVICIDALYSTDGSIPDLPRYLEIAERRDCVLVLDEAHSFGILGADGGGLAVAAGVAERVHFRTVSLSKALGGHGGLVAGSGPMIRALKTRMRSVVFSSATSAVLAAGHCAALELVIRERDRSDHCLQMGRRLAAHLEEAGLDTRGSASHIVSVFFESEEAACQLYGRLRDRKILTSVFVYPAVAQGSALVRFSVYADLTAADIDYVARCTIEAVNDLCAIRKTAR